MKSVILGSNSPNRLSLLKSIGIKNIEVISPNIDETEFKHEKPAQIAKRLSIQKMEKLLSLEIKDGLIITADSVASVGIKSLPKAETKEDVINCLKQISGKKVLVHTGVCVASRESGKLISKVVKTEIKVKRLTTKEIEWYADSGEGTSKAGGFSILGLFQVFTISINGQVSNVVGLPLYETKNMLESFGYNFK